MEFRDIVVPLDGSTLAEHALPLAAELARQGGGCVRLIAVVPGASFMDPADLPEAISAGLERTRQHLRRYIEDIVARVRRVDYVRVTGEVRVDSPVEGILQAIDRHEAQLVVMTSHGRGGIKRAWLGSTADELVRRASVPLLVLKPETDLEVDLRVRPAFASILVPLDGSAIAESALEPAIALARVFEASLVLMRVVTTPYMVEPMRVPYGMKPDQPALLVRRDQAQDYLRHVEERLRAMGVEARSLVLEEEAVADAIVDAAREHRGSVVALATHGLGGVKRMLIGSIADKVLRGADVPLLITRPIEPEVEDTRPAPLEPVMIA